MLAVAPQCGVRYFVDQSAKSDPNLGLVLAVAQGQLRACVGLEGVQRLAVMY